MKTPNRSAYLLASALLAVCALDSQTTGSVAGAVLENGVRPLAGASVFYRGSGTIYRDRYGRIRSTPPHVYGTVQAGADGTFSITGLPTDQYEICAGGPLPIHVSSCQWNTSGHDVAVAAGQNVTGLRLTVSRGALLDIAIVDATGCAAKDHNAPVYAFVGTMSSQAHPVPGIPGVYHYQVLVPQSAALRVSANHHCSFSDGAGNALSNSALPVSAVSGESASVTMTAR